VLGETKRERVTRYRPIVDPEDEPETVSALRAACRAFELVDVADGALRACVLLRLADLLERRGGDANLRDALSAAESAVAALDTERDASVSNAVAEWIDAKETLFASGGKSRTETSRRRFGIFAKRRGRRRRTLRNSRKAPLFAPLRTTSRSRSLPPLSPRRRNERRASTRTR
jgi:hypothetical protein